jgi:hypothetical protein
MRTTIGVLLSILVSAATIAAEAQPGRPRIAVFSGPVATIQNSAPLVTSNKAREQYGLPPMRAADGAALRFDHLAPQRLAKPVEVFIEQFSAHPLERDAEELYAPPDGYLDAEGRFYARRQGPSDRPVYRVTLAPEDGLYSLPYMARQADGSPWEDDCAQPGAPAGQCRQPFFPDAARIFEEIDRGLWGLEDHGHANALSTRADFDFYRALPSGGYKRGLPGNERTDAGDGDIPPEAMGEDFFAYRPYHLLSSVRYDNLARLTNAVQEALGTGDYDGAIWLEGSPTIEETVYWLNLLIDTPVPIVGNAAQRANRLLSADGARNIVDAVDFIASRAWAGADGRNRLGAVMIQDEQIFAARQVQKSDARPGGYVATGDHGGVLGAMGVPGPLRVYFEPDARHTWQSEVRLSALPSRVSGVALEDGALVAREVRTRDERGRLIGDAIPRVSIVKASHYSEDAAQPDPADEPDILARIDKNLRENPLAGFIAEGLAPYGVMSNAQERALQIAAYSGMPVVHVGRGNAGGVTPANYAESSIGGNNLSATKARLLLTACLLKFGSLPPAKDPGAPTAAERDATRQALAAYQAIFDTH